MGDDIGFDSVTDCRLRSFSNPRQHSQQCRVAPWQKSKQTQPQPMLSPINFPAQSKHSRYWWFSVNRFDYNRA